MVGPGLLLADPHFSEPTPSAAPRESNHENWTFVVGAITLELAGPRVVGAQTLSRGGFQRGLEKPCFTESRTSSDRDHVAPPGGDRRRHRRECFELHGALEQHRHRASIRLLSGDAERTAQGSVKHPTSD
jgi:hypothetical protein